jgi:hypothetical protein
MRTPACRAGTGDAKDLLLDRHGEPRDQPRYLVQMFAIVLFNGSREPTHALVIADGGNVAWDDRRYRA